MADEHARLYDGLREKRARGVPPAPPAGTTGLPPSPLRFRNRSTLGTPLVSVIVPCFNHGRVLPACLNAIRAQTYPQVEIIVVDDGSTEPETVALLDALEREDSLTTIRLAENGGPGRARNVALERCTGRFVLPVDADNVLLPDAIERLVAQLTVAGEDVGFIYPNVQYFGNRSDYYRAHEWDLYGLLHRNTCDVCSLFDREIFQAGGRFDERIRLGHEDWEFILRIAARGVRGEPAHGKTLVYNKWGFNRSDAVEYAAEPFCRPLRERSPLILIQHALKAEWSPALSLIALETVDPATEAGERLAERLAAQSCADVELLARYDGKWPAWRRRVGIPDWLIPDGAPPVRRFPASLARSPGEALAHAREHALGRLIALTAGTGSALLGDRAFVEKLLRLFAAAEQDGRPLAAVVMVDAGGESRVPLSLVDDRVAETGPPHTVVWSVDELEDELITPFGVDSGDPVGSLVEGCIAAARHVQWRHFDERSARDRGGDVVRLPVAGELPAHQRERLAERISRPVLLPHTRSPAVPRWAGMPTWMPPHCTTLCRHRERGGQRRLVTQRREPPRGYELEYDLGQVRVFSYQGTAQLVAFETGNYATTERDETCPPGARSLGYIERAALPLLEPLVVGWHRSSEQRILVCGPSDPLGGEIDPIETLGFIDPFPVAPRAPHGDRSTGLIGLTSVVDRAERRHRYAAGSVAEGDLVGEIGALLATPHPGAIPVWIIDDSVRTDRHQPPVERPSLAQAARWTFAPASPRWTGVARPPATAGAMLRRSATAALRATLPRPRALSAPSGPPVGWLRARPGRATVPLFAAYHPVTGDQLLTRRAADAKDMGYGPAELLGHLNARAPLTGVSELRAVPVPWASRYGVRTVRG